MKKYILALLCLLLLCFSAACSSPQLVDHNAPVDTSLEGASLPVEEITEETEALPDEEIRYELALITDGGDVESGGFNQSAWEGLSTYGDTFDINCQWYQPAEASTTAFSESIAEAVKNGARLVVCSGSLFEAAVFDAQYAYPEIHFICIDCDPTSSTGEELCEENTCCLYFSEEQIGFLAGYAAVMEGYTRLGFMGAMAIPSIMSYGAGFLQGADVAAKASGATVEITMGYTGSFLATPETQTMASTWYLNNIQCIFACGGDIASSVMVAAEAAGTVVICADTDRYADSDAVLTSAIKNIETSVFNTVSAYYSDKFPAGQLLDINAEQDGVALAMEHARFVNFTKTQHSDMLTRLANGEQPIKTVDSPEVDWQSFVSPSVKLILE